MNITLTNTGKRYNRDWIFRNFTYTFTAGRSYAITGINGSGKSTLLQVIGGAVLHSEGKIDWLLNDKADNENAYKYIALAAPYLELIEEMTANELLSFHTTFKPLTASLPEILETVGLAKAGDKQIRYYSSGMKQRLKLAQAFFSKTNVLLLDEPVTNLDEEGISVYRKLLQTRADGRMIIVSSNDRQEYDFCDEVIKIADYK